MRMFLLIAALLLVALFAGCIGGKEEPPANDTESTTSVVLEEEPTLNVSGETELPAAEVVEDVSVDDEDEDFGEVI